MAGTVRLLRHVAHFSSVASSSSRRPPHIAVVGSGPAGLYATQSLLRRLPTCRVSILDVARAPFGLVRRGVAPDHQDMKKSQNALGAMFDEHAGQRVRLVLGVRVGEHVSVDELLEHHDAVLLAYGAFRARRLECKGAAEAQNLLTGADFVTWYNGAEHATKQPNLDVEDVVILGNGNVALDCARVIARARQPNFGGLEKTDLPFERLQALATSKIRKISIIGRRGVENVSFTIKELRELLTIADGWRANVRINEGETTDLERAIQGADRRKKRLLELLRDTAKSRKTEGGRANEIGEVDFLFNRSPLSVKNDEQNRIQSIVLRNSRAEKEEEVKCGLLIASLGFRAFVLPGLPQNAEGSLAMHDDALVADPQNRRLFATGWCAAASGRGHIADTQIAASAVAARIADDLQNIDGRERDGCEPLLRQRNVPYVDYAEWKRRDQKEVEEGKKRGKIREKDADL